MIVKRTRYMLFILAALLAFSQGVLAQSYDAGKRAYDRGDFAGALEQWRPLANKGHAEAQYWLGHMYFMGEGVRQNDAESLRWFRRSAEQGDEGSMGALGMAYWEGWGVRENLILAYKWMLLAAMQGDPGSRAVLDLLREEMTRSQIRRGERLAREWLAERE